MEVELKSDWQEVQVELLKNLHGYEFKELNDEAGYVDYVAKGDGVERKLLRVIVGPKHHASKAFVSTVENTLEKLEDDEYDEATLIAESFTSSTRRRIGEEDDLEMISPDRSLYSTTEVYGAIQDIIASLCEKKCGGLPNAEEDCDGLVDREYRCEVRKISDDSDFHARMRWLPLLMNDFSRLIELQREMEQ
jgi:hypothetical protein